LQRNEMSTDLIRRQRQLVGLALGLALLLRVAIAWTVVGSNDARTWKEFAAHIREYGLIRTYQEISLFNHPPLMGWFSWFSLQLGDLLPGRFIDVFKTPMLLSEVACAWLLWRIWRKDGEQKAAQVVLLFAFNLISILISSYHGNTDCVFATLCLASAYALHREKWLWAGLALGAAINVKIVPLMLIPVFALMLPSPRALLRFGGGLALCALPFVPVIWQIWPEFYRNVFAYNSMPFEWGVPLLIETTQGTMPRLATWLSEQYVPNARFVILGFMLLIGGLQRWRRQLSVFEAGALAFSVFLVLLPGFGVQYLVWPLPLLFAAHPRTAVKYSSYGGVFALLVYYLFWTGQRPWFSEFTGPFPPPAPFVGVLAWVVLIGYCVSGFRKLLASNELELPAEPLATVPLVTATSR
jgi:hypothetical protein